jgi:hypothetical protein
VEGGYTHYLWGNFYEEYALSRAVYRRDTDDGSESMPLTSPFGPGVIWSVLQLGSRWPSGLGIEVEYEFRTENTRADLYETPYRASGYVARGPRRYLHRVALRPSYRFGSQFGAYVEPAVLFDDGTVDFEGAVGLAYHYSSSFRP